MCLNTPRSTGSVAVIWLTPESIHWVSLLWWNFLTLNQLNVRPSRVRGPCILPKWEGSVFPQIFFSLYAILVAIQHLPRIHEFNDGKIKLPANSFTSIGCFIAFYAYKMSKSSAMRRNPAISLWYLNSAPLNCPTSAGQSVPFTQCSVTFVSFASSTHGYNLSRKSYSP